MYDMWGTLSQKYRHERLIAIPAAVGPQNGWATFRRSSTDMCSSLKGFMNNSLYHFSNFERC
jgi:hypothetical protein